MRLGYHSSRVIRRPEDMEDMRRRMRLVVGCGILGFLILLSGLWYKQIVQGKMFKELSEKNYIRLVSLKACRGDIYDRKGVLLADNQPLFKIVIIPQELKGAQETVERLSQLFKIDKEKVLKKIKSRSFNPFQPVVIKNEVDMKIITTIEERKSDFPGVFIQAEPRRDYPFGELAAHLLGYLGRMEDKKREASGYREGELVGRTGIEKTFQRYLKGNNGGREVLVNSRGEQRGILGEREAIAGDNLILTIDKELQEVAEKSLEGKRGAIVAIDPENGDVLALASSPAFDPNIFTKYLSPKKFKEVSEHPGRPFFNRAIAGLYPPASTFKIVIASAALEKGVIKPETTLTVDGERLNLIEALAYSSDPFFYKLGEALGVDNIAYFARQFGLGEITGIDLPYEKKGLVPDRKWRRRWPRGEVANLSIGQGALQVTPLQMANLIATVANGGKIYRPRIVKEIISPEGKKIKSFPVQLKAKLSVSKANLDVVKSGLLEVVNKKGKRGTGWRARMDSVKVAGKTGTAETTDRKFRPGEAKPYELRDDAWFVAFAPFKNPKIALAVLVEHGGWGGVAAAPLAKKMLEAFFRQENKIGPDEHGKIKKKI
ncbi:MAG: penicillin-binding protein 2 [Nitrospirae bacterium]|nr:penicillin-binding protein 2 [Nitrospirota bacterium]